MSCPCKSNSSFSLQLLELFLLVDVGGLLLTHMGGMWELSWSYGPYRLLGFVHSSVLCVFAVYMSCTARQPESVGLFSSRCGKKEWRNALPSPCLCFWWTVKDPSICFENLLTKAGNAVCALSMAEQDLWKIPTVHLGVPSKSYTCRCSVPHLITRQWFKVFEILSAV